MSEKNKIKHIKVANDNPGVFVRESKNMTEALENFGMKYSSSDKKESFPWVKGHGLACQHVFETLCK